MTYTKQQMNEYTGTLNRFLEDAQHIGYSRMIRILDTLHHHETTLHRISENECNGHPRIKTEYRDGKMYRFEVEDLAWAERDAKKETSIQKKVRAIADELHFKVEFNGDPRGGSIQFILPSGRSNSIGGNVWGIFW